MHIHTKGKLTKWNDDRGFGFITPDSGGKEIFVHISAFPKSGGRPCIGEVLSFEIHMGKEGKPKAVNIQRANTTTLTPRNTRPRNRPSAGSFGAGKWLSALLIMLVAGGSVWRLVVNSADSDAKISEKMPPLAEPLSLPMPRVEEEPRFSEKMPPLAEPLSLPTPRVEEEPRFRCDGRTHCSQMTSCAEAEFFLRNCPGVEMDGNHDGEPCEAQWCN